MSHPHITFHQLALGEAENVAFHRSAATGWAKSRSPVPPSPPLPDHHAGPLTAEDRRPSPDRWGGLWNNIAVWRRKNEEVCQQEALTAETGATGTLVGTLKRLTDLLLGASLLTGLSSTGVMPPRRRSLGSDWRGWPAPFSLEDPMGETLLRENAGWQSGGAGLAIAKRQMPLLPRHDQVETFPLYTLLEKTLNSIAVEKEKNRVYVAILNHNRRKYGDGKLYRMQKKNRGNHFHHVRYVDMDGKLIPVRVVRYPGQHLNYEIYDVGHPAAKGFPIKFDGARWVFDKPPAEPLNTRPASYRGGANHVHNFSSPADVDHVFLRFG
ncbi:hypothetical protein SG0607 [Sodalis glossinidius str. 'morsitans']|uniref:Uncharacterized protein n=1 Tax=Sodalis glossinidius (strain morsitans) TaxID=343509 RepID=Q2NVE3_SODGM|nr:hypothetical protein [Sodalis glossinidius]BAE73882.1 hypothetical protein SG0607 [Sodalis glossinidius str. 'morsitans']